MGRQKKILYKNSFAILEPPCKSGDMEPGGLPRARRPNFEKMYKDVHSSVVCKSDRLEIT